MRATSSGAQATSSGGTADLVVLYGPGYSDTSQPVTFQPGTDYFMVMIPGTISGFTAKLVLSDDTVKEVISTKSQTIKPGVFGTLAQPLDSYVKAEPESVDLGLPSGIKWATFNVGATKPEGYGEYYAWGETEPKSDYSWATYKWCDGDYNKLTKYCSQYSYGKVDSKRYLEAEDDVATVEWDAPWRTPTDEDWNELIDNCNWAWTTQSGIKGYRVTGKKSGYTDKSIFLPAAGEKGGTSLSGIGSELVYWSSDTVLGMSFYAYYLTNESGVTVNGTARNFGFPIRPVQP